MVYVALAAPLSAAIGGLIAWRVNDRVIVGALLSLFLGPLGWLVVLFLVARIVAWLFGLELPAWLSGTTSLPED